MTDPFKNIADKLFEVFSQGNLSAIALKVSDKYNDAAVSDSLSIAPPVLKDTNRVNLFDNSDKAFIDSLGNNEYSEIADEIAIEVTEGFNG
jgi:hypothetical protein